MTHTVKDVGNHCDIEDLKIVFDHAPDFMSDFLASEFSYWQPLYDLYITNDKVVITIEMAGIDISDFTLYVNKNNLIINGARRLPDGSCRQRCTFHHIEIPNGQFFRKIDFPVPVMPREFQYTFKNGLFTIDFAVIKERIITIEEG